MTTPAFDRATTLTIRRTFPAARERVFRAWTEPEVLQQWFRPMGMGLNISKLEMQVGGSFCFDLADGSDSMIGTYLEIVRPEKLVFTWSFAATRDKESVVTVEFIKRGSSTEVILTHQRLTSKEMLSSHQAGWQSLLDQLAQVLRPLKDS